MDGGYICLNSYDTRHTYYFVVMFPCAVNSSRSSHWGHQALCCVKLLWGSLRAGQNCGMALHCAPYQFLGPLSFSERLAGFTTHNLSGVRERGSSGCARVRKRRDSSLFLDFSHTRFNTHCSPAILLTHLLIVKLAYRLFLLYCTYG